MSDSRIFYSNIGVVESISDGIINILGLQNAANGEMVEIFINSNSESNEILIQKALILNLGEK
jgi:F0F1-type ATP synthase alpha subunit